MKLALLRALYNINFTEHLMENGGNDVIFKYTKPEIDDDSKPCRVYVSVTEPSYTGLGGIKWHWDHQLIE